MVVEGCSLDNDITWELRTVEELHVAETQAMFNLMLQCYDNVQEKTFSRDLADKHWVLILRSIATGDIVGFSTQKLRELEIEDIAYSILFSGDTVVQRKYWGKRDLLLASACLVDELMQQAQGEKFFWFLISKGYKTYHFLPVLFREFYPSKDYPTPRSAKRVIDYLGSELGGELYDVSTGVIKSQGGWYVLKQDIAEMTTLRTKDPHAQFFVQCNPGFGSGDELCCLAELNKSNYTNVAMRLLRNYKPSNNNDDTPETSERSV
tara:strand:- start:2091 stop:2882 length:792 start_codon:yes stop_codon:yes gene_type:complete